MHARFQQKSRASRAINATAPRRRHATTLKQHIQKLLSSHTHTYTLPTQRRKLSRLGRLAICQLSVSDTKVRTLPPRALPCAPHPFVALTYRLLLSACGVVGRVCFNFVRAVFFAPPPAAAPLSGSYPCLLLPPSSCPLLLPPASCSLLPRAHAATRSPRSHTTPNNKQSTTKPKKQTKKQKTQTT